MVMPEHVHLLACPREREYDAAAFCGSVKLSVVRRAVPWVRKHAPGFLPRMLDQQPCGRRAYRFWQRGGGFDRNLTEPATVRYEIDYVHLNPVRRGLCDRPEEWVWSSARDYAARDDGWERDESPLSIDFGSFVKCLAG